MLEGTVLEGVPEALHPGGGRVAAIAAALLVLPLTAAAQSASSLQSRLAVDGFVNDFTPVENVFRTPDLCAAFSPPLTCSGSEEPPNDSAWSALQEIQQLYVTWDAEALYVGVSGRIADQALVLLLDFVPGGLSSLSRLQAEPRRALDFGPELVPDAIAFIRDRQRSASFWRVVAGDRVERVDGIVSAATFEADASGRALEMAIPWTVLFPDAPLALNPAPGAPAGPMHVLPATAHAALHLAAAVVHATPGFGSADVAPDGSVRPAGDPARLAVANRAALVEWDADPQSSPRFVDFGAAVQLQALPRFVPPLGPDAVVVLEDVVMLDAEHTGAPARLLVAEAGRDLEFVLSFREPHPATAYVTARILSPRGERIRNLYREVPRAAAVRPAPFGPFSDPAHDRWDGRDDSGRPVPGGVYVLQVSAGPSPGVVTTENRQAIAVVR